MDMGSHKSVILVLGGVRGGKNRYAQQLTARADRIAFIATAERGDDEEMRTKIERYRAERPQHWVEALDLTSAIEWGLELGRRYRDLHGAINQHIDDRRSGVSDGRRSPHLFLKDFSMRRREHDRQSSLK